MAKRVFSLHSLESAWGSVLRPWFQDQGRRAWRLDAPTLVVGDQGVLRRLRALLHANNLPALGLEFVSLGQLEDRLLAGSVFVPDSVLEEVASACAHDRPSSDEVAAAVARSPRLLTESIRFVEQGGWGMEVLPGRSLQEIGRMVLSRLKAQGLQTRHQALRAALQSAASPLFGSVLLVGMDGRAWPHWLAVLAAIEKAQDCTVLVAQPGGVGMEGDISMLASIEEACGVAVEYLDSGDQERTDSIESGLACSGPVTTFAAPCVREEATQAISAAAGALVQGAERIAIIAPPSSVVAREISLLLEQQNWPSFNGLASRRVGVSDPAAVASWMEGLSTPTMENLEHFFTLRPTLPVGTEIDVSRAIRALAEMRTLLIFPEIAIGLEYARLTANKPAETLLGLWPVLPSSGTIEEYSRNVQSFAWALRWNPVAAQISEGLRGWDSCKQATVTREGFFRLLREVLLPTQSYRPGRTGQSYGRVQLIAPKDALYQEWDFVIFAGQNDGIWPPAIEPGCHLSANDLKSLNSRIRKLNRGSDEAFIADQDHGYVVGPMEGWELHLRDFARIIGTARQAMVLCATHDEANGGGLLYPGEFFQRACLITPQNAPESVTVPLALQMAPARKVDTSDMLTAWHARRNAQAKDFSEYEFCLHGPPNWDLVIPPSDWGRVFDKPSEVFYRRMLGVTPKDHTPAQLVSQLVKGKWVHGWLEAAAPTGLAAKGNEWVERVQTHAQLLRNRIAATLLQQGRAVPTWWDSFWQQATAQALGFAHELSRSARHPYLISEAKLPETVITLPSGRILRVRGRMDLLFMDRLPRPGVVAIQGRPWLFDFKTGIDKPLSAKALKKGEGIQLGLYSLALKELGAEEVDITLLPSGAPAEMQVTTQDVLTEMMPWLERLAEIAVTGRFGYWGAVRGNYAAAIHPIAALPVGLDNKDRFARLHSL